MKASVRILVVDDYEPWRRFERLTLLVRTELQIIGECSDGDEAIQEAEELKPHLILLDIGLPTINGLEAARRIQQVSPSSKILFVTENRSPEIAQEALSTGADGYVVKSNAASELLPAIKAVLEGKQFISASLASHFLVTTGPAKKVEVFSAGCSICKETIEMVKRLAGSHEIVIHDMNSSEIAEKAKRYGVRSVPAVVIDGKLASCSGRGPEENILKSALA